jgi:uncharacterized protein (DUF169 family)
VTDWMNLERVLTEALHLSQRPVAVTFLDSEPAGVQKFQRSQPSGCSFWRLASAGRTFYTVPADHYNCAVGSYTHNIDLPPERAGELDETLGLMMSIGYVRSQEIPGIPRLPTPPAAIAYSPLGQTPVDPSVVLFASYPRAAMLLNEAALRVGAGSQVPMLGRPTCMALPAALTGGALSSLGCIGNRIYTDLADDELYTVVKGSDLSRVAAALDIIVKANETLAEYSRNRRQQLSLD